MVLWALAGMVDRNVSLRFSIPEMALSEASSDAAVSVESVVLAAGGITDSRGVTVVIGCCPSGVEVLRNFTSLRFS